MPGRKGSNPQCVPAAAEDEQLPPDGLDRVGEQGNVNRWTERVGSLCHPGILNRSFQCLIGLPIVIFEEE